MRDNRRGAILRRRATWKVYSIEELAKAICGCYWRLAPDMWAFEQVYLKLCLSDLRDRHTKLPDVPDFDAPSAKPAWRERGIIAATRACAVQKNGESLHQSLKIKRPGYPASSIPSTKQQHKTSVQFR